MLSREEIDAHVESSRTTFEQMHRDREQFTPTLMVYRDEHLIAQILPTGPGDGAVVQFSAQCAVQLFRATDLIIVMDSYASKTLINPVTNEKWRHGEMAEVAEKHDGRAKGWVTDAVVLMISDRSGHEAMIELPYRLAGKKVHWSRDTRAGFPDDPHRSAVPDGRLIGLFTPPSDMPEVPDEMTDLAAARIMTAAHCAVALAVYGPA